MRNLNEFITPLDEAYNRATLTRQDNDARWFIDMAPSLNDSEAACIEVSEGMWYDEASEEGRYHQARILLNTDNRGVVRHMTNLESAS